MLTQLKPATTRGTSVNCLAVNAAFLQEIKDDNRFLDELLLATRDALTKLDPDRLNIAASVELLRRLRDRLAMHFTLEEAFGYMEGATEFPSELAQQADYCRQQHASLYLDLCEIVDRAESLMYDESKRTHARQIQHISTSFGQFYRRILQHDVAEEDLIMATFEFFSQDDRKEISIEQSTNRLRTNGAARRR